MNSKILLIRHGITEGNKKKWFYGHVDLPLAPEGIEELERQKEEGMYPELPDDALCFTTGLGRTAETFRILFGNRGFEAVKDLREINFGICECKTFDELKDTEEFSAWMYDEAGDYQIPEGESQNQFKERVARGFEYVLARHRELLKQRESACCRKACDGDETAAAGDSDAATNACEAMSVVICHGGVIAQILSELFPNEKESKWDWMPEPGSGYYIDVNENSIKPPCLLGRTYIY